MNFNFKQNTVRLHTNKIGSLKIAHYILRTCILHFALLSSSLPLWLNAASAEPYGFEAGVAAVRQGNYVAAREIFGNVLAGGEEDDREVALARAYSLVALNDQPAKVPAGVVKVIREESSREDLIFQVMEARLHLLGLHPESNAAVGIKLIKAAAVEDCGYAFYTWGLHLEGKFGGEKNLRLAAERYQAARGHGFREAFSRIAAIRTELDRMDAPAEGYGDGASTYDMRELESVGGSSWKDGLDRASGDKGLEGGSAYTKPAAAGGSRGGAGVPEDELDTLEEEDEAESRSTGSGSTPLTRRSGEEATRRKVLDQHGITSKFYQSVRLSGNKAALKKLESAADKEDAIAQGYLSILYTISETNPKKDLEKAEVHAIECIETLMAEVDRNNPYAQWILGKMHEGGIGGISKDDKEAIRLYQLSAEQGYTEAIETLKLRAAAEAVEAALTAQLYQAVRISGDGALSDLESAADKGDAIAQGYLSILYTVSDTNPKKDLETAHVYAIKCIDTIREEVSKGNPYAQWILGRMSEEGIGGLPKNDEEAFRLYQLSADQGHAAAQNNLGDMYCYGRGVDEDDAEAVDWYRKAAEQGLADAQNNLGVMYDEGKGVEADKAEAVDWYRKAAEQGLADAQYKLGVMYDECWYVVDTDEAQAVDWYRKAAEQGHAAAQYRLGSMYANGRGVDEDEAEAVDWYRKAAEQGHEEAIDVLKWKEEEEAAREAEEAEERLKRARVAKLEVEKKAAAARIAQLEAEAAARSRVTSPAGGGASSGRPPVAAAAAAPAAAVIVPVPRIPAIATGHEAFYQRLLAGRLEYRPTEGSDAGLVTLSIGDLLRPIAGSAKPLSATFDLSRCGDAGRYLSINIGYKKAKIPANENKVEVWICPKFLAERGLDTFKVGGGIFSKPKHPFANIMKDWDRPVGYFWTWGDQDVQSDNYDYLLNGICMDNDKNLYEKWEAAVGSRRTGPRYFVKWRSRGNGMYHFLVK